MTSHNDQPAPCGPEALDPAVQLLEATMKTEVPAEAESRMRAHLDSLRQRLEAAAADRGPAPRDLRGRVSRASLTVAAAVTAAALLWMGALLLPPGGVGTAAAGEFVLVPEGGRLDALDERGQLVGPCPLKQTDVDVHISGHFTRVDVAQRFHNPYDHKIEAVYTFPLSHRGAVDRMTMTVGDRVVQGEVKERAQARRVYEAARDQGHVAALLEQERPNIFTQSVANIEPGAEVLIEISYVEVLQSVDGEYRFDFPMVVAPRYTPGRPLSPGDELPEGALLRRGVILPGPARLRAEDDAAGLSDAWLRRHALPIDGESPIIDLERRADQEPRVVFTAEYAEGGAEPGAIFEDGVGHVAGRWFICAPRALPPPGAPFAVDTDQVPDASRVTPMPVKPDQRAGHDVGVRVTIDTGGPGITELASSSHDVVREDAPPAREDGRPHRTVVSLEEKRDIPNRDFRLAWRLTSEAIEEAVLTHTGRYGDFEGGFFTLILQPPARIPDEEVRPRELIFVLDQSGSMTSARLADRSALDAAKDVIRRAIDTMRPNDRFNIISFQSTLDVLWEAPRPNSEENREAARQYIDRRQGGGGTEMRNAVLKALGPGPAAPDAQADRGLSLAELANLPADGREVTLLTSTARVARASQIRGPDGCWREYTFRAEDKAEITVDVRDATEVPEREGREAEVLLPRRLTGRWETVDGRRLFVVTGVGAARHDDNPMRIVLFVTDGLVSNDDAIVDAIRRHAHETRVFTIGMSHAPNRHLLDEMARAGRGAVDYLLPEDDVDPIVQRFAERIATPVLTDIELDFDGPQVTDVLPSAEQLPDLFDVQPLVIHGRYAEPGQGTLTIRGRTGAGAWERSLELELPKVQPQHDMIATLWAREQVGELMRAGSDKESIARIVELGETFQIVTQHTSFVAVERQRVTLGGKPVLVRVPIEFPKGMSWEGIFGKEREADEQLVERLVGRDATVDPLAVVVGLPMHESLVEAEAELRFNAPASEGVRVVPLSQAGDADRRIAATNGTALVSRPSLGRLAEPGLAGRGMYGSFGVDRQLARGVGGIPSAPTGLAVLDESGPRERLGRRYRLPAQQLAFGDQRERSAMAPARVAALEGIRVFPLRRGERDEAARRLRELLHGGDAQREPEAEAFGRVLQPKGTDSLFLLVSEPVAEIVAPFAQTLAQEGLSEPERRAALDGLLEALARRLPVLRRDGELRRRLDTVLYNRVVERREAGPRPSRPDPLRVTVLLRDLEAGTLASLRQAGFKQEATAENASFVVGRIDLDRLEALALLETVRRIERVD